MPELFKHAKLMGDTYPNKPSALGLKGETAEAPGARGASSLDAPGKSETAKAPPPAPPILITTSIQAAAGVKGKARTGLK